MEIRQLYYVLEVAKLNSFSKAANAQFITQPAISQQISALEEELQVRLFKRDTHSVVLTKEGEKFCAYAKDVVDSIDRLMAAFHQSTTKDKTVIKVGVFPFYKAAGLTSVINSFFAANHNVIGSIKVEENYKAYEKLETGELNFAIIKSRLENIQKSWVKYEVLCSENLNVLISRKHPYAQRKVIELSELGQFSLLTGDQDSHFYNEMRELYEKNHIDFNVAFLNTGEVDMMLDMVKDNIGISLVTDSVGRVYENEEIDVIPIEPKQEILTFLAYPRKRRLSGAYLAFKNHVIDAYRK